MPPLAPDQDLDFLVHLRMFKESTQDLGVTSVATEKTFPRGWIEKVSYFTIIPPDQQKSVVEKTKMRWTLAMPPPGEAPSPDVAKKLLDKMGVQGLPLLFADTSVNTEELLGFWAKTAWRPKPKSLRFVVPKPVVPKVPSPKLNANQGQITTPTF